MEGGPQELGKGQQDTGSWSWVSTPGGHTCPSYDSGTCSGGVGQGGVSSWTLPGSLASTEDSQVEALML